MTEDNWPEYYSVLGQFVVDFENVVFAIRQDIRFLLMARGLKDEILGEIIFGQKVFTAEPLLNCYVTLVNQIVRSVKGHETVTKRLDSFKKRFGQLIESRNDIVHSTHFFVESINLVGKPRIEKDFKAFKPSPKKNGYELKRTMRIQIVDNIKLLKEIKTEFKMFAGDLHTYLTENGLSTVGLSTKAQ